MWFAPWDMHGVSSKKIKAMEKLEMALTREDHVNASGFPLQIAIQHEVESTRGRTGWFPTTSEHAWMHKETGKAGFIDLVLEHQGRAQTMIVECKRVQETDWIFLVESSKAHRGRTHAKVLISEHHNGVLKDFGWTDVQIEPATPESEYCVIPNTDKRSPSLIERGAADLVTSTEAFAIEERPYLAANGVQLRLYYNIIVTTANLCVCHYSPSNISLIDGKVTNSDCTDVKYLRFRKQLSTALPIPEPAKGTHYGQAVRARKSTVFVVNSQHLVEFLEEFRFKDS